jgi:hypothetical protein
MYCLSVRLQAQFAAQKPDTGEVAERLNALVLKTSKG